MGPGAQVKHEVESWILNPTLIADLGDLSDKYLGEFGFPGTPTRLTRLKFGRSSRSDPDTYQTYYNGLISTLNIGSSCPYLNNLNVAKCISIVELDLGKCTRLQVLDAEGCTGLTTVNFPANSILEEVYLPANMTSLTLTNQPYLTTLVLEKPSSLNELTLDRVTAIDSYHLTKNAMSAGETAFYLTDINWVIDDEQNGVETKEDGITYLTSIDILEQMAESLTNDQSAVYPKTGYTLAQALTGTITIKVPNVTVVEYDMYKYDVIMNKNSEHGFARTGDAFKSRVGVCGDIADLFLRMAKAAGIKVDIISGYAGNDLTMDNFKEAGHAWNAVYINGKWLFVDATWGMGGNYRTFENVRSHIEHRRKVRQKKRQKNRIVDESRTVDDKWFLVKPEEMIKTHFPRREKQQHLKRPVDMKKVFRENARNLKRKR